MEALVSLSPPSRASHSPTFETKGELDKSANRRKMRDSEIITLTRTVLESVKRTVLGTIISLSPKNTVF